MRTALSTLVFALFVLVACDTTPENATIIDPSYTFQCMITGCSGHGRCGLSDDGNEACFCEAGYVGDACEHCEVGFHRGAQDGCFPDHSCAEQPADSCGPYGTCKDDLGVIECVCQAGYGGSRCELCADGYRRGDGGVCNEHMASSPDFIPACTDDACNGHGACTQGDQGAYCVCSAGYEGSRCGICSDNFRRKDDGSCAPRQTCEEKSCNGHGSCSDVTGAIDCTCDPGFGGSRCDSCVAGYHLSGAGCAPDLECGTGTCAGHGTCAGSAGALTCTCETGYDGGHCDRCSFGYKRSKSGQCVLEGCESNPIKTAQNMDFNASGFPTNENNCQSGVQVNTDSITFKSRAGQGLLSGCANHSALYKLDSPHLMMETTRDAAAQLVFSGVVSSLSFDYARSDVELEVVADGKVVAKLAALAKQPAHATFEFVPPVKQVDLRSTTGDVTNIAVDNLYFAPPPCE